MVGTLKNKLLSNTWYDVYEYILGPSKRHKKPCKLQGRIPAVRRPYTWPNNCPYMVVLSIYASKEILRKI